MAVLVAAVLRAAAIEDRQDLGIQEVGSRVRGLVEIDFREADVRK